MSAFNRLLYEEAVKKFRSKKDIYEGYEPEAREYFEALDDSLSQSLRVVWCECDLRFEALLRRDQKLFVCTNGVALHSVERILSDKAVQEYIREKYPLAKAITTWKPSRLQRLLDWLF